MIPAPWRTRLLPGAEKALERRLLDADPLPAKPPCEFGHGAGIMGTSTTQLEDTYARWLQRTDDRIRAAFDAYDRKAIPGDPGLVTTCAEMMSAPLVDNQGRSTCSPSF